MTVMSSAQVETTGGIPQKLQREETEIWIISKWDISPETNQSTGTDISTAKIQQEEE